MLLAIVYYATYWGLLSYSEYKDRKKHGTLNTMEMCLFLILMIFAPLVIPVAILYVGFIQDYLDEFLEARKHGGYKKYKEWKKQKNLSGSRNKKG